MTLDEANQRWAGAHCRSRQSLTLKKGRNKEGWTKTGWLYWDADGGNQRARVWFTEAEALRRALGHDFIPVGSEFVATGWKIDESGNSLMLELQLAGTSSRVKVYYWDSWVGRVGLPRLHDFEQWARFDLFELTEVPSERLVEVGESASTPASAHAPGLASEIRPMATTVEVLAASVEPARVASGGEIHLVAIYTLEGVPEGGEVEVEERRMIFRSGTSLASLDARVQRGSGTHRSSQSLRLPATVEPGVYELRVSVSTDGTTAQGKAIFQVGSH